MSQTKNNLIANLAGKGVIALLSVIFIPYYIALIGIESWGLVGFYLTLSALVSLFDMGLGTTINREMARLSIQESGAQEMRNLTRTLEIVCWVVATCVALLVLLFSSFFASHWIHGEVLLQSTIRQSVCYMGLAIAFQWPSGLYIGGLTGLQKQVLQNGILVSIALIRAFGMIAVLIYISPTIQTFFIWQIGVNLFQTLFVRLFFLKILPRSDASPQFDLNSLKRIWRFALGISGIAVVSLVLTQLDKVILSKILPLAKFGYYSLAATVAAGLYCITGPVFSTFFPRFSELIALGDMQVLKKVYHESCQIMSILVIPVALIVALFSKKILSLWISDPSLVVNTHQLVELLLLGTMFNALVTLPYALQLAFGWTKLALYQNVAAILLLMPLLFFGVRYFGAIAAGWIWVILNFCYFVITIPIMHRKIMQGEKWRWYLQDVGLPLFGALATLLLGRWIFSENLSMFWSMAFLLVLFVFALLASALLVPYARRKMIESFVGLRALVFEKANP